MSSTDTPLDVGRRGRAAAAAHEVALRAWSQTIPELLASADDFRRDSDLFGGCGRGGEHHDHLRARTPRREQTKAAPMSLDVAFIRLIDAGPEAVFDAFTDPEGHDAFYGQDDPGWIVRSQCDLRVEGVWTVGFGPSPRERDQHRHVFAAIRVSQSRRTPRNSRSSRSSASIVTFVSSALPPARRGPAARAGARARMSAASAAGRSIGSAADVPPSRTMSLPPKARP